METVLGAKFGRNSELRSLVLLLQRPAPVEPWTCVGTETPVFLEESADAFSVIRPDGDDLDISSLNVPDRPAQIGPVCQNDPQRA